MRLVPTEFEGRGLCGIQVERPLWLSQQECELSPAQSMGKEAVLKGF